MYKSNLKWCLDALQRSVNEAANAGADVVVVGMKLALGGPSPSSPGNVPGKRSGRLQQAISAVAWRNNNGDAETLVGIDPNVNGVKKTPPWLYGIFLENGTRKMQPRPFFGPISRNSSIQAAAFRKAAQAAQKAFE